MWIYSRPGVAAGVRIAQVPVWQSSSMEREDGHEVPPTPGQGAIDSRQLLEREGWFSLRVRPLVG